MQEAMRVRNTLKQNKIIRLSIYNTYAHQSGVYHLDTKSQVKSRGREEERNKRGEGGVFNSI